MIVDLNQDQKSKLRRLIENKYYSKFESFRDRKLNLVGDFISSMTDKEALEG